MISQYIIPTVAIYSSQKFKIHLFGRFAIFNVDSLTQSSLTRCHHKITVICFIHNPPKGGDVIFYTYIYFNDLFVYKLII